MAQKNELEKLSKELVDLLFKFRKHDLTPVNVLQITEAVYETYFDEQFTKEPIGFLTDGRVLCYGESITNSYSENYFSTLHHISKRFKKNFNDDKNNSTNK